jgi:NADH-quinone oxidoreductase subunit J
MSSNAVIACACAALASVVMLIASPALAAEPTALGASLLAAAEGPPAGALGNTGGAAMMFWVLALATLAGAVFVITRRNLVAAVMGLVLTFYAMLFAHFLAVLQVLVYAGAIMVLFVFVIMILNKPEDEPWAMSGLLGKLLAGVALAYFMFRLGGLLWGVKDTPAAAAAQLAPGTTVNGGDFGSVAEVGRVLFTDYLFAFEAISVILLSAVVGAIAIARPGSNASADEGDGETDGEKAES